MTLSRTPLRLAAALALGLALPSGALAASEGGHVTDVHFTFEGPFGRYDARQLQRGFQIYHEICSSCHGLKFVAFRDLGAADGPAFPEEQVKAIAAQYQVPDTSAEALPGDTRAALPADKFPVNTSAGAPDLSLMAKARAGFHGPWGLGINQLLQGTGGPEYIYSYLQGFTGEEQEVAGNLLYGNSIFAGGWTQMAPVLYGDDVTYEAHGEGGYTPPEATQQQEAKDVAAFLMWAAEPKLVARKEAGFRNVIWLVILAVLLYYTNRRVWEPVKGKH